MASENASAIAIAIIPPRTAMADCVLEYNPTIIPRVVTVPEVTPKLKPTIFEWLIFMVTAVSNHGETG